MQQRLYNLKKLRSLSGIENLVGLEELEVNGCTSVVSIKEIGNLVNLKKLQLCDDGNIDSLTPLEGLNKLQTVLFYGSTNIIDGDLSPLVRLDNLMKVEFQDRKHYSPSKAYFVLSTSAIN